jgi:hypothetical protein
MSSRKKILVASIVAGSICATAGLVSANRPGSASAPPHVELYNVNAVVYDTPTPLTDEQRGDLVESFLANEQPPAGITFAQNQGHVIATSTGLRNIAGHYQVVVTLTDDTADLDVARFYVGGVLKSTASRANGHITDNPDQTSTASLTVWLNANALTTYTLQWDTAVGVTWERKLSFQ